MMRMCLSWIAIRLRQRIMAVEVAELHVISFPCRSLQWSRQLGAACQEAASRGLAREWRSRRRPVTPSDLSIFCMEAVVGILGSPCVKLCA